MNSAGDIVSNRPGADATERAAIAERVRQLIGYFSGELPSPAGVDPAHPRTHHQRRATFRSCAMQVTRDGTVGAVSSYAPSEPCGCYFEAIATGSASVCATCDGDGDCNEDAPKCRHGYCEPY